MPAQIEQGKEYCVAQVNFTSAEVSHLNCSAKDMIVVIEKYPTGWWRGQVADKSGIFDSSKVTKLTAAEAKKYIEDNKNLRTPTPAKATATPAAVGPAAGAKESPLKMGKRPAGAGGAPGGAQDKRMSFTTAAPVKTKLGGAGGAVPTKAAAATTVAAAGGKEQESEGNETWTLAQDKQYVVCNADLTAHIPTHLQASKGDVIMVVQKYQTGWYRGVTALGATGIFDKKKVREATFAEAQAAGGAAGGAARTRREKPTLYRVEAMFDYVATAANQLSLIEGEVVNILQEADKGWLQAERPETGDRGFVPASYVERLQEDKKPDTLSRASSASSGAAAAAASSAAAAASAQAKGQAPEGDGDEVDVETVLCTAVVEYDWTAEEEGQMSLVTGDRIEVLEESEGGWWRGRNLASQEEGFFPSSFVTVEEGAGGAAAPATPAGAAPAAASAGGAAAVMCRALYDYQSEDPDTQLSFQEGDLIEMLEEAEGGWARGLLKGLEGYFPLSFVEQLAAADTANNNAAKAVEQAAAKAVAATREMEEAKKRQREEEDKKRKEIEKKQKDDENERLKRELERQKEAENERLRQELERQKEVENARLKEELERRKREEEERERKKREDDERVRRELEEAKRLREEAERKMREEEQRRLIENEQRKLRELEEQRREQERRQREDELRIQERKLEEAKRAREEAERRAREEEQRRHMAEMEELTRQQAAAAAAAAVAAAAASAAAAAPPPLMSQKTAPVVRGAGPAKGLGAPPLAGGASGASAAEVEGMKQRIAALEAQVARFAQLEQRLAALEALPKAIDEERSARVALEDSLQELEVTCNTHGQEITSIHAALQDHADAIDAVNVALYPPEQEEGGAMPRYSMRIQPIQQGGQQAYEEDGYD